jgi:hypothetical protein
MSMSPLNPPQPSSPVAGCAQLVYGAFVHCADELHVFGRRWNA